MSVLKQFVKDSVRIRDPERVERILSRLINDGPDKLQVLVDFDYTLTRYHFGDGLRCDSSWGVMEKAKVLPPEYKKRSVALMHEYRPHEVDPNKTIAEKIPIMEEWYAESNKLLVECGVSKESFRTIVETTESRMEFREGTEGLMASLAEMGVPALVISAGLGDIVKQYLEFKKVLSPNLRIISNFIDFDSNGVSRGIKKPIIHVFNKNEKTFLESDPSFKDVAERRKNAIVIGDSMGDLSMADGIGTDDSHILKVGFLNHDYDAFMDKYTEHFDVVLVDDQTMDFPKFLFDKIRGL